MLTQQASGCIRAEHTTTHTILTQGTSASGLIVATSASSTGRRVSTREASS